MDAWEQFGVQDLDLVRTSPCAITVILIASILNEKIYYLYNYIRVKYVVKCFRVTWMFL